MTLTDIIALAKQGYKPSDIKELLSMGEQISPITNGNTEKPTDPQQQNAEKPKEDVPDDEHPTLDGNKGGDENIEDLKKELKETKDALEKAQKVNVDRNLSGAEDDVDKQISDMFREYM